MKRCRNCKYWNDNTLDCATSNCPYDIDSYEVVTVYGAVLFEGTEEECKDYVSINKEDCIEQKAEILQKEIEWKSFFQQ